MEWSGDAVPKSEHQPVQGQDHGRDDEQVGPRDVHHPGQGHQVDQLDAVDRQVDVSGKFKSLIEEVKMIMFKTWTWRLMKYTSALIVMPGRASLRGLA